MYIAHNTFKTLTLGLERETYALTSLNAIFEFQIQPFWNVCLCAN